MEQVEAVKQEKLRREEQQRIQREADMEGKQVRARELEMEQEFNLRFFKKKELCRRNQLFWALF